MKPGHLAGNRFAINVRGVPEDRLGEVAAALERIAREGVAERVRRAAVRRAGRQRAAGPRVAPGRGSAPRDPRLLRLLWSSLQSAVFNAVLDSRVEDGTWATALEGDLLKLRSSGGLFGCADVQTDGPRVASGEVSPTGPIIGARMRWPEGRPAELERQVSARILGDGFDLARTRSLGEGSRRALRLWVEDLRWETLKDDSPTDVGEGHGLRAGLLRATEGIVCDDGAREPPLPSKKFAPRSGEPPADEEETDGAIAT